MAMEILNPMATQCAIDAEQRTATSPIFQFYVLHHVLIPLLTRLRLKRITT